MRPLWSVWSLYESIELQSQAIACIKHKSQASKTHQKKIQNPKANQTKHLEQLNALLSESKKTSFWIKSMDIKTKENRECIVYGRSDTKSWSDQKGFKK